MRGEAYLTNDMTQTILAPTIQATCCLKPEETIFFPPPPYPTHTTYLRTAACPSRSLPHNPTISTHIPQTGPPTPPPGAGTRPPNPRIFPMSRYGLPSTNRNITGGLHILTIDTQSRNNTPPLDRDIHNPPSHEGRITSSPTPVDI